MIKFILYFLTLLMSFFAINKNNVEQQESKKNQIYLESKIDTLFKDIKNTDPGVSLGILKNNKLIIQKNYGLANLEYQIPVTNTTVFHAASVSKQFTAFALLLLEAEGKLSLDDDIRKYIPEMHDFNKKITLRHLATHTSGLKDQHNIFRLAGWNLDDIITNKQALELIYSQKTLNFNPNDQFMYSNSGYTLLAEVIARVSKQPFSKFTKERIFIPLKMNNTLFVDKTGQIVKNKAYSYYKEHGNYRKDIYQNSSVGASNISTTIEDLTKWSINFHLLK